MARITYKLLIFLLLCTLCIPSFIINETITQTLPLSVNSMSFQTDHNLPTVFKSGENIQVSLIRTPTTIYGWQSAIIFANVVGDLSEVSLNVTITISADTNASLDVLQYFGLQDFFPYNITINYAMRLIPITRNWYVTAIPGLPAITITFQFLLQTYAIYVNSTVHYELLIDGEVKASDNYIVHEKEELNLPPIVMTTVYDVLQDPEIFNETFGLGPKGWGLNPDSTLKVLVVAFDDHGLKENNVVFEYSVSGGTWTTGQLTRDPLMNLLSNAVDGVNSAIDTINYALQLLSLPTLPTIDIPLFTFYAEIPPQNLGNWVMFRANATDSDGEQSSSPMGFYYIKNGASDTRVLIVDPHVKLWLLQENLKALTNKLRKYRDYEFPSELLEEMTILNKLADIISNYSPEPFHHWELLGKYYDIYIAYPDQNLQSLLKNASEGGFEPHAIILSNLWLGLNIPQYGLTFTWDLKDIKIDEETTLFDCLRDYVKSHHAGLISTYGTLSDWIIWTDANNKIKIGSRGHVGNSPEDLDILNEKTVAAMLGLPELALWEYIRDKFAETLVALGGASPPIYALGLLVGSLPLQVPSIPFNGTLKVTFEGTEHPILQGLPEEFTVECPSIYNQLGYKAYTQVGWQLAMPRAIAYEAWNHGNNTRDIVESYVNMLGMLLKNVTNNVLTEENATKILDSLKWGLHRFYRSIIAANITESTFNITLNIPSYPEPVTISIPINYQTLLQLLPVKIIAISDKALAGIIASDRFWDEHGYRSIYFSFEVEASDSSVAELLLKNAVSWAVQWQKLNTTELLGNLVRVPKETAQSFRNTLNMLPGNVLHSSGTILVEEGYSTIEMYLVKDKTYYMVVVHPTCDKVSVFVLEGDAEISSTVNITARITNITITASSSGTVKIGVKADPDSSLNPTYVAVKGINNLPVIFIESPANKSYIRSTVTIAVNATDDDGITSMEILINGTKVYTASNGGNVTCRYSWNTRKYVDGFYNVTIIAYDHYTSTIAKIIVFVDNTPPSIQNLSYTPTKPTTGEDVTVIVTVTDAGSGVKNVLLSYSLDGVDWVNITMNAKGGNIYEATIPGQPAGKTVQFKVIAFDVTDNVAVSSTHSYKVTSGAPTFEVPWSLTIGVIVALIAVITLIAVKKHRK